MMDGFLSPHLDPLNPQFNNVDLTSAIDALADHAGGLVGNLAQHNQDALAALQAPADALTTKIQGPVLGTLASLETKSGNIVRKLDKDRQKRLGNAYQGIFPAGGSWQPIEHVVAGLQTGDIFGPVGLGSDPTPLGGPTLGGGAGNDGLPPPPILPPPTVVPPVPSPLPSPLPLGNPPPIMPPPVPIGVPPPGPGPTLVGGGGNDGGGTPPPDPNNCYTNVFGDKVCCATGWSYDPLDGCRPPLVTVPGNPPPIVFPPGSGTCEQTIKFACARTPQPAVLNNGVTMVQPVCLDGNPTAPDPSWQLVSIQADVNNSGTSSTWQMWIPGTWSLCCDMTTGVVWAADQPCAGGNYCNVYYTPAPQPPPTPPPTPPPATCPEVPPVDCPQPPPAQVPQPDNAAAWCQAVATWLENLSEDVDPFFQLFGMNPGSGAGSGISKQVVQALTGSDQPLLPQIVDRAKRWAKEVNRTAANASSCQSGSMVTISAMRAAADLIQSYLHILPPQFVAFLQQAHNTLCQWAIPSPTEADRAYLADAITKEEWECYHKAAGNLLDPRERLIFGERERPGPREIDLLHRRGYLDDDEFNQRMRQSGVMQDSDIAAFSDLNNQWPDKADLIRYMIRGVFDEDNVRRQGLDGGFDDKYVGDAVQYAAALGLPVNHLRYAWRAQYELPSQTALGQMWARNRPGRVPDEAVVTDDDVKDALRQQHVAPKWIPAIMEVMKQPLTRVDTRRMYQIHAATEDDLKEYYLDLRYSDEDADQLVKFAKRQRDVAEAKASGLPSQRAAIQQYARGEMTSDELDQVLAQIALTPDLAQTAKQSAQLARTVYRRTQATKGIRRQYVAGLIDDGTATTLLLEAEVDGDEIEEFLGLWSLDRRDKGKHASAAQLCQWRAVNLINPVEQADALVRVGWSAEDAGRIVSQCDMSLSSKAAKLAEKAAKEAMKEMEKQQKEALAALKARGKVPGPPSRRIVFIRDAKGERETDTTTVPIIPAEKDIAAAEGGQ